MSRHLFKLCAIVYLASHFFVLNGCSLQSSSNDSSNLQRRQTPANPAPDKAQVKYDFTPIDKILEGAAQELGGCALVLVKGDEIIYRKSFGRFAADKVVPIASASKWLSGVLVMTLVDEGKLSLDDRVSKYLPEFGADKSKITIRHLFAHTSGLPPEAGCRNDKRTTLERCAQEIARVHLRAAPGEEFYYGGASMHVGGRVAEIAGGKSWHTLFAEKIAGPLDLSQTDFLAYGPTDNPRPEGDARSTADDYSRFLQMIINRGNYKGRQIISPESIVEMHKDQTGGARITYTIYGTKSELDPNLPLARYGIGVWREAVNETGKQLREASSQGALGFSPWIDLERNLAGVLSVQSSFSRVLPLYLELKNEIRRIIPPDSPITVDPGVQNAAVGRRLMDQVMLRVREQAFAGVRLVQAAYHNRSLSLYTKLGFVTREPLSLMQGPPLNINESSRVVRSATEDDADVCNQFCLRIHGHERRVAVTEAISQGVATVCESNGRITGYTTIVGFLGHTVGESNDDVMALIGAAREFQGPGFLLPTRNSELLRWCLKHGLRIVMPMTLMSTGLYNIPGGPFLPSVIY